MRIIICFLFLFLRMENLTATDTPVLGILTLEAQAVQKYFPNRKISSYIAASYVKFLESAGARAIPVWIGQNQEYYERVVQYTNGLLLPGGATYFDHPKGYAEAAKKIFDIAQKQNDMGVYYPLIGICLGMEVLAFASAGGKDIRVSCSAVKISLPLEFEQDFRTSKTFEKLPNDTHSDMKSRNVTYNYHKYCLTDEVLEQNNLTDTWRIVTKNEDINGDKFISVMEHKKYPFYGFQFHPEKIKHEFQKTLKIPHDLYSNQVSQYFADFSVGECRKNNNSFPDKNVEHESMIYNFCPSFGPLNCTYFQLYLFTDEEPKNHQLK